MPYCAGMYPAISARLNTWSSAIRSLIAAIDSSSAVPRYSASPPSKSIVNSTGASACTCTSLLASSGSPSENSTSGERSTEICAATGRRDAYAVRGSAAAPSPGSTGAAPEIGSRSSTTPYSVSDCTQPRPVYSSYAAPRSSPGSVDATRSTIASPGSISPCRTMKSSNECTGTPRFESIPLKMRRKSSLSPSNGAAKLDQASFSARDSSGRGTPRESERITMIAISAAARNESEIHSG